MEVILRRGSGRAQVAGIARFGWGEIRTGREDPRYTDYFFFINDKLWRRYRAFSQDQFEGIPFEDAAVSFEKRFGPSRRVEKSGRLVGLEWQDSKTRLEALDNTAFYGIFCLIFSILGIINASNGER